MKKEIDKEQKVMEDEAEENAANAPPSAPIPGTPGVPQPKPAAAGGAGSAGAGEPVPTSNPGELNKRVNNLLS
jgi:hypothetical protein